MTGRTMGMAAALAFLCGNMARTADLDEDTNLNVQPPIPLEGGTQNVAYNEDAEFGEWTGGYNWGDRHGDDTGVAVEPPGLNLGEYNLINTFSSTDSFDRNSLRLNLNGGDLTGAGGHISTDSGSDNRSGDIIIHNVGNVALGDGYISVKRGAGRRVFGRIHIGEADRPADNVQAAYFDNTGEESDPTSLYTAETFIYSTGNVLVEDSEGNRGDILSNMWPDNNNRVGHKSRIRVYHHGMFRAKDIWFKYRTSQSGNEALGLVEFDGAAYGDKVPKGSFSAGSMIGTASVRDRFPDSARTASSHDVVIRNYTAVHVEEILVDTFGEGDDVGRNRGHAGGVWITNIVGNINIASAVSAWGENESHADNGVVVLQSNNGGIAMGTLDLSRVKHIVFSVGNGAFVQIAGEIRGTDGELLTGEDGVLSNGGNLRAPQGTVVQYRVEENPALGGASYALADENGNTDPGGGTLRPWAPRGTVFKFQ